MNTAMSVEKLTIGYPGRIILSDATFEVTQGEIFTILGGSGCGKTTLMRCLIGLDTPLSGSITASNKNSIGVMFQSGALMSAMTLLENVMLPLEEHTLLPRDIMEETARLKLSVVGLAQYGRYYPSEVSGGMVKRAAIARAMALDPEIVFLDEPSAGLDPITRTELDTLIQQLAQNLNITFIMVTHELDTIRSIVDRAIVLHGGVIAAQGSIPYLEHESTIPFVRQFFHPKEKKYE